MAEETKPEKKRARVRHLTAAEKAEAITLWKSGTVTVDDLAIRFKRDRTTFLRLFKESGIEKGSDKAATEAKVKEAVDKLLVDDATILAKRIKDSKEEQFRYIDVIGKLTWDTIRRAKAENRAFATIATDLKALEMGTRIFKMVREEKYILLGIRPEDENEDKPLPELVVQELTAQDIEELHQRSLMADDELGLNDPLGDEELMKDLNEEDRVEED